jgi:CHAT domain-containing protein
VEPSLGPVPRVLLVAQPEVAALPNLPNALVEADVVATVLPSQCMIQKPDSRMTSVHEVVEALGNVNILHLACHAHQDQHNPLSSGFDICHERLTLGKLMQVDMPHAQLAYLSACESAAMDETRPDEGVNLADTMLFVGFKSVIATMW